MSDETNTPAEPEVTSDAPPKAPTQGERIAALEETARGLASTVLDLVEQCERLRETDHTLAKTVFDLVEQGNTLAADVAMVADTAAIKGDVPVTDEQRTVWIDRVLNKYHAHERPE